MFFSEIKSPVVNADEFRKTNESNTIESNIATLGIN
jgi:hypothetical protein